MDETNPAIAAQRTLFALSPDGVGSDLVLTISVPTASEFGSTCKVAIGFIDPSLTLHGVDAWQAIHLSMRFIASRVGHFEEEGWKFYWEEGGDQMHAADLAIETKQDTAEAKAEYEASTEEVPFTPEQEEMLRQIALKSAPEALQKLENANSDDDVFTYLPRAAAAAFHLERFDDAQRLAERCLALAPANQENWNYGNALHAAHTVLGLLALRLGDLADACNELLQSGDTPGSPQLGSFGPTMQLAKALLRQGQTAPVLAYLEKCRVFWKMGGSMLDLWEDKIKSDQVPNFFQHTHV